MGKPVVEPMDRFAALVVITGSAALELPHLVFSWMSSLGSRVQSSRKRTRWVAMLILFMSAGTVSFMQVCR